jgi:hypothetical protein
MIKKKKWVGFETFPYHETHFLWLSDWLAGGAVPVTLYYPYPSEWSYNDPSASPYLGAVGWSDSN